MVEFFILGIDQLDNRALTLTLPIKPAPTPPCYRAATLEIASKKLASLPSYVPPVHTTLARGNEDTD